MTQLLPPKKEVALALLERSNVDVYLDPRARGVVVPPQFRKEPRLILKIGLNMPVPIPDLRLDEESMSCTLSFNRSPFYCVVPWSSVFAMVGEDGRGMVWPDDVPQELAVKVVEPGTEGASSKDASAPSSASGGKRSSRGSKIAADAADPPSVGGTRRGGAKKKPGKKEEAPRPTLVAVPSQPQEAEAAQADRRPRPSQPSAVPERRDGVSAIPSARRIPPTAPARPDGARPKRELPPYLRVVK
jgi:stringent starvation protein B